MILLFCISVKEEMAHCTMYFAMAKGLLLLLMTLHLRDSQLYKSPLFGIKFSTMRCTYRVGDGSSEPSSKRRNTPPGPEGRELQGPESSPQTGWGPPGLGTSSSDTAAQKQTNKEHCMPSEG